MKNKFLIFIVATTIFTSGVAYSVSSSAQNESEGGIQWNDPDINIDWKLNPKDVILSAKDISRQSLKEYARANGIIF